MEQLTHFFKVAQEVNFNLLALYEKEPLILQTIAGILFALLLLLFFIVRSKLHYSAANKAVEKLESYVESFDEYQEALGKILRVIRGLPSESIERLKAQKEAIYKGQLATMQEMDLVEKLQKYPQMAQLYRDLAAKTTDEELAEFFEKKSQEIVEKELVNAIDAVLAKFAFTPEDVATLEAIVTYTQAQDEEHKEALLERIMDHLKRVDFGSDLNRYRFVENLNAEHLGSIYDFIKEQQEKLFEKGDTVVAAEVLEYLLENGQEQKVINYIKALQVPTHLQELYYRFFNQKGMQDLDFAFIANPLTIQQEYASYLESMITHAWRDDKALEALLENKHFERILGHDRVRQIIERIDQLRKEIDETAMAKEALETAKEAYRLALETKTLMEMREKRLRE